MAAKVKTFSAELGELQGVDAFKGALDALDEQVNTLGANRIQSILDAIHRKVGQRVRSGTSYTSLYNIDLITRTVVYDDGT